jgi:hypothetical protein
VLRGLTYQTYGHYIYLCQKLTTIVTTDTKSDGTYCAVLHFSTVCFSDRMNVVFINVVEKDVTWISFSQTSIPPLCQVLQYW